jgi:hypothetical protein
VYFIPFEIETYAPVTQQSIISSAWEKWTISSQSETSRLFALLAHGAKDTFDEKKVRGLVLSNNRTYAIDSNGVVLTKGKLGIRIDKAAFIEFRDSLGADQRLILKK